MNTLFVALAAPWAEPLRKILAQRGHDTTNIGGLPEILPALKRAEYSLAVTVHGDCPNFRGSGPI